MNCYQDNNNIADTSGNLRKNMSDKELQQKLTIETNPPNSDRTEYTPSQTNHCPYKSNCHSGR